MLFPLPHPERADIFSSHPCHLPTSSPGFEKGIPSLPSPVTGRAVKPREGRARIFTGKEERSSSFRTTLPPPALTLLVVKDTGLPGTPPAGITPLGQTWFQDSFACANLTSSTRNGLFSRAVFFFFLTWSESHGQKYSGKPFYSGFSLAPWGFSQGNLTPCSPAPKDAKITDLQQSLKISV